MNGKRIPEEQTNIILDSITDGVFTVDNQWHVTSFNSAAEEITGMHRDVAIGQPCKEVFRSNICEGECALKRTMETGKPIKMKIISMLNQDGERVPVSISTALLRNEQGEVIGGVESFRDMRREEELRKQIQEHYTFHDIVSKSASMREIFDILPSISESDSTVLIRGETGTGKELVARAIHNMSLRKDMPMIAVNCSALPDQLLESELFGYKAGAFTDARKDKIGRFGQAEGGSIMLDEIGDISPALQVRLLRVLQEKEYEPLGCVQPERANVRVITATNRNLEELVATGQFREDLYYRINIIDIDIPPLRKRKEDIPLLVRSFIQKFNCINNRGIFSLSPEALELLMMHDFPGNVRELENIIEHAFIICRGNIIEVDNLPEAMRVKGSFKPRDKAGKALDEAEAQFLLAALHRNNGNRLATARELGIHKSTLFRKIKKYGLQLPKYDGRSGKQGKH